MWGQTFDISGNMDPIKANEMIQWYNCYTFESSYLLYAISDKLDENSNVIIDYKVTIKSYISIWKNRVLLDITYHEFIKIDPI